MRLPLVIAAGLALAPIQASSQTPDSVASQERQGAPLHSLSSSPEDRQIIEQFGSSANALIHTPVGNLVPGNIPTMSGPASPVAGDPAAVQRGQTYFNGFNCVGCHAPNGGGGMGRSLSNRYFQYGGDPANLFLTTLQGRPYGMSAWGNVLPDAVIWDLVAYVGEISKDPAPGWGTTVSQKSPTIEQVPAEFYQGIDPW